MPLTEKTETRFRLLVKLLTHFHNYMNQLEEYDSKSFPNGANRSDDATLDDFAHYLAKTIDGREMTDTYENVIQDVIDHSLAGSKRPEWYYIGIRDGLRKAIKVYQEMRRSDA